MGKFSKLRKAPKAVPTELSDDAVRAIKTKPTLDVPERETELLSKKLNEVEGFNQGLIPDLYPNSRVVYKGSEPTGAIGTDPNNQIRGSSILESGKGYGTKAYEQIADDLGVLRSDTTHSDAGVALWEKLQRKHPGKVRQAVNPGSGEPFRYKIFQPNTDLPALQREMGMLDEISDLKTQINTAMDNVPESEGLKAVRSQRFNLQNQQDDVYKQGMTTWDELGIDPKFSLKGLLVTGETGTLTPAQQARLKPLVDQYRNNYKQLLKLRLEEAGLTKQRTSPEVEKLKKLLADKTKGSRRKPD